MLLVLTSGNPDDYPLRGGTSGLVRDSRCPSHTSSQPFRPHGSFSDQKHPHRNCTA
jgi:hypothetical protein